MRGLDGKGVRVSAEGQLAGLLARLDVLRAAAAAVAGAAGAAAPARAAGVARVVVAGERGAGKSSLVNALFERPGLLPLDPAWARVPTVLRHGPVESVEVVCVPPGAPPGTTEVRALDDAGAMEGAPLAVRIALPVALLEDVELVDTPGIGDAALSVDEIVARQLSAADALIFVVDGSAPLLAPQADFLSRAARSVGTLIVAVTRIEDLDAADVADVVEESAANLARRDPGLGPVRFLAVSAYRAERAAQLRTDRPELAARLGELSGMPPLRAWLATTVRAGAVRGRALAEVRALHDLVRRARETETASAAGLAESPERWAQLQQEHERLVAFLKDQNSVRIAATHRLQRIRLDPRQAFDTDLRVMRDEFRERATAGPAAALESLPADLEAALALAAERRLLEAETLAEDLGRHLEESMACPGVREELIATFRGGVDWDLGAVVLGATPRGQEGFGMLGMIGMGGMAGRGAAAVVVAVTGGGALVPGIGMAAGAVAMMPVARWRHRQAEEAKTRNGLATWASGACTEMRTLFAQEVERRALAAQQCIETTLPALAEQRSARQRELAEELKRLRTGAVEERSRAREAHRAQLAELDRLLTEAEELLCALQAVTVDLAKPAAEPTR